MEHNPKLFDSDFIRQGGDLLGYNSEITLRDLFALAFIVQGDGPGTAYKRANTALKARAQAAAGEE